MFFEIDNAFTGPPGEINKLDSIQLTGEHVKLKGQSLCIGLLNIRKAFKMGDCWYDAMYAIILNNGSLLYAWIPPK